VTEQAGVFLYDAQKSTKTHTKQQDQEKMIQPYKKILVPDYYDCDQQFRFHFVAKVRQFEMELYDSKTRKVYEFAASIGCFTEMELVEGQAPKKMLTFCQKNSDGAISFQMLELGDEIKMNKSVEIPINAEFDHPIMIHDCPAQKKVLIVTQKGFVFVWYALYNLIQGLVDKKPKPNQDLNFSQAESPPESSPDTASSSDLLIIKSQCIAQTRNIETGGMVVINQAGELIHIDVYDCDVIQPRFDNYI